VVNGVFYATDDGQSNDAGRIAVLGAANYRKNVFTVVLDSGLLQRVEPQLALSTPNGVYANAQRGRFWTMSKTAVTITSLLHPRAHAGYLAEVRSGLNPDLSGLYQIHQLEHAGDTHASTWETRIESLWTRDNEGVANAR
jgi:hypothetical protein